MTTRPVAHRGQRPNEHGFTLIELLIVIAILGITFRIILPAFQSDVPIARVRAEARKLAATMNYLRTEARLQSRRYGVHLWAHDGKIHGWRILMPPELKVRRESDEDWGADLPDYVPLDWRRFPKQVQFRGIHVGRMEEERTRSTESREERKIWFDGLGRTPQKIIVIGHRDQEELAVSIRIPPVAGPIEVEEGASQFRTASDGDF